MEVRLEALKYVSDSAVRLNRSGEEIPHLKVTAWRFMTYKCNSDDLRK